MRAPELLDRTNSSGGRSTSATQHLCKNIGTLLVSDAGCDRVHHSFDVRALAKYSTDSSRYRPNRGSQLPLHLHFIDFESLYCLPPQIDRLRRRGLPVARNRSLWISREILCEFNPRRRGMERSFSSNFSTRCGPAVLLVIRLANTSHTYRHL